MDEHYVWTVTGKTIEDIGTKSYSYNDYDPDDELCRKVFYRFGMRWERKQDSLHPCIVVDGKRRIKSIDKNRPHHPLEVCARVVKEKDKKRFLEIFMEKVNNKKKS